MYDASAMRDRMLQELDSAIGRNMSFPGYWYRDSDVSQFELDHVVRRSWQPCGPVHALKESGDYLTTTVAGVPVLLLRDREGELRGYLNMCRHRGHPVAFGTGRRTVFVYQYHGWSYRHDGTLLKAPRSEREPGFDCDAYSLVPVKVGIWGDLGFVNLDPDAEDFAPTFEALMRVAEENDIGLSTRTYRKTLVWEQACNWKTFMDNTADCYHCRLVHPGMGDTHMTNPDDYVNVSYDTFAFHCSPTRDRTNMASWMACGVWPNWTLQAMQGQVSNVRVLEILGANHIRVKTDFFAPPEISDEEVDQAADWYHRLVYGEDRPVCEGVATNIMGGRFQEGPILLESEHVMQDFQKRYRVHLAGLRL